MMGLTMPREKWTIRHALWTGESPGDWGHHRDKKLEETQWELGGNQYKLIQTPERHVWKVVTQDDEEAPQGFLLTYVDDMLIL